MGVSIVIPARYASSRFEGKPLALLTGATGVAKSLIERSWRAASAVQGVDQVWVATDDARIAQACDAFGAQVVMTDVACKNGTERCADALERLGLPDDEIIVNLQGDAPLTPAWFVEDLIADLRANPGADVATPVLRCDGAALAALKADRQVGRVGGTTAVFGPSRNAMYFSKEVIPFVAQSFAEQDPTPVFHHVGAYAYRPDALRRYIRWPEGHAERLEGLEQLRFLEQGATVLCTQVAARDALFWELNNPEDVPVIEKMMNDMNMP